MRFVARGTEAEWQPLADAADDRELREVVDVVDDVVRTEREGVSHEPAGRQPDGRHRVGVDDEVVATVEDPVDEPLGELDRQLARELGRVVVVVEERDVEVRGDDVPARPRPRLTRLVLVEGGDERPVRGHRSEPWHAVVPAGIRHEVLHERPDAAHDATDHRGEGCRAGHERQPGRRRQHEVRVEVDEVVPPLRVCEVRAAVGRRDEDDRVDRHGHARAREHALDERPRDEPAAAVRDDVDDDLTRVGPQEVEQVARVALGVDAQGAVVEPDDGVVRVHERVDEALGTRGDGERAEGADRRGERAVHEEQDAGGTVGRQAHLRDPVDRPPRREGPSGDVDETGAHP